MVVTSSISTGSPVRAAVAIGPSLAASIANARDSEQNVLPSPRTSLSAARRAVVTCSATIVYDLRLSSSPQNIVYEAPRLSYAYLISALGSVGAFGIFAKLFGQDAVSAPSLVPYSMTPPSKGTKAICALMYFLARSARSISA